MHCQQGGIVVCDLSLLPTDLEACRLDDALLARGYETFPAEDRARLKTTQALVMSLYAERPDCEVLRRESAAQGFARIETRAPAPWALFLLPGDVADAPRVTSMLMAARLGSVPLLAAGFLTSTPETIPAGVLSALELCGIEHAFALDDSAAEALLRFMAAGGAGRLAGVALPGNLVAAAQSMGVRVYDAPARPSVALDPALASEALETIRRLLPGVTPCFLPLPTEAPRPTVLFHADETVADAQVILSEALAGCWLEAALTPDFFLNGSLSFTLR